MYMPFSRNNLGDTLGKLLINWLIKHKISTLLLQCHLRHYFYLFDLSILYTSSSSIMISEIVSWLIDIASEDDVKSVLLEKTE